MNWKTWLKGLAAVAIGGAATGAVHAVGNGQVNANTAMTAGVGALVTVLAYLIQSPLAGAETPAAAVAEPAAADGATNPPKSPAQN